jgi:hypothetical protein
MKRNAFSEALKKVDVALTIYPADPVAIEAKKSLSTLVPLSESPMINLDDFSGDAVTTDKGMASNLAKAANLISRNVQIKTTITSIVEDHLVECRVLTNGHDQLSATDYEAFMMSNHRSPFSNGHWDTLRVQILPEESVPTKGQTVLFYGILETANYEGMGGVHCDIINAKMLPFNAISELKESVISTLSAKTSDEQSNGDQ